MDSSEWNKPPEMVGRRVAHYQVLEKLGGGGMGIVYKAQDLRLDRAVALKFLPPHLATSDEAKTRLIREAKAASALDHPNICTIYEIGEHEGQLFLVMAYYEGETLKRKIEHGPLSVEEALDFAVQIADGLSRAHESGIIHRDVKPANVMVTRRGRVKLVDFGLAKAAEQAQLTQMGTTLGTVAYMSPEQARGEAVDARTDIWSLGVVLFEMLSGRRPFRGEYEQAGLYSILNEDPESLLSLRSGLPERCDSIVRRALAKDVDKRYPTVDALLEDLAKLQRNAIARPVEKGAGAQERNWRRTPLFAGLIILAAALAIGGIYLWREAPRDQAGGNESTSQPAMQRLAVLPFTNVRGDPDMNFLGFALADQIIGTLAYVKNVLVRPSSAIRQYQGEAVDTQAAGDELRVDYLLMGNFLKEGEAVRLNVELVDVNANELIWREDLEVTYENTFQLQDIVAENVLRRLNIAFSQADRERLKPEVPLDPLAYEYYLRGLSYPLSNEGNHLAVAMLERSLALDSTYAPAFAELGYRLRQLATYDPTGLGRLADAEAAFQRALSLNGDLLAALGNLAGLYTETGKSEDAVRLLRRTLTLNPNSANAHFYLGYVYRYAGCLDQARDEMETAVALDPQNPRFRSIGATYTYRGDLESALQGLNLDSASTYTHAWKGQIYIRMNQENRAMDHLNRAISVEPEGVIGLWATGMRAHLTGHREEGLTVLRKLERRSVFDGEQWYNVGNLYGLLGDAAGAARNLEKAVDGGFFNYPFMMRDTFLQSVRANAEVGRALAAARRKHEDFVSRFCAD